jgi:co-chaperonin GroES (HSP10)
MKIIPKNRHLLVELIEDEQEDKSAVLLPDDYKPMKEFTTAKVVAVHSSVSDDFTEGSLVVAESQMFKKVTIGDEEHYLLQANYALCEVTR